MPTLTVISCTAVVRRAWWGVLNRTPQRWLRSALSPAHLHLVLELVEPIADLGFPARWQALVNWDRPLIR